MALSLVLPGALRARQIGPEVFHRIGKLGFGYEPGVKQPVVALLTDNVGALAWTPREHGAMVQGNRSPTLCLRKLAGKHLQVVPCSRLFVSGVCLL